MIDWFRTVPMSFLWVCHIGGYGAISHEKLKEFAPIELAQLNVKWAISDLFFFIFVFSIQLAVNISVDD